MLPFKQKTEGTIKRTTVLLILLCISQTCFGFLHEAQRRQARSDDKPETRRVSLNYERRSMENSPHVRDVRADSRQSRIDARDIRTDFREIRSELRVASARENGDRRERTLETDDRRVHMINYNRGPLKNDVRIDRERTHERREFGNSKTMQNRRSMDNLPHARDTRVDSRRVVRVDLRDIGSNSRERGPTTYERREFETKQNFRINYNRRSVEDSPHVRDMRVESRQPLKSRREVRVDSRDQKRAQPMHAERESTINFDRRLLDSSPFARATRVNSRREIRQSQERIQPMHERSKVRQTFQSRSKINFDRRSMDNSPLIRATRVDSRREVRVDSRDIHERRVLKNSDSWSRSTTNIGRSSMDARATIVDSRQEIRDNSRERMQSQALENSVIRQNVPQRSTTSTNFRDKSRQEDLRHIRNERIREKSEVSQRISPDEVNKNYRFSNSRRETGARERVQPVFESRETPQHMRSRERTEVENLRFVDSRRETRDRVSRERVQPVIERRVISQNRREGRLAATVRDSREEIYSQSLLKRQLRDSSDHTRRQAGGTPRSGDVREKVLLSSERRNRITEVSNRRETERNTRNTRDSQIRERRGQYGSLRAVRSDINNNLEETFQSVNGRKFDPFKNQQNLFKFQQRVVETDDHRRTTLERRSFRRGENVRMDALLTEKVDLGKLKNATFIPQDKINVLVNAVQAILVIFLLRSILENTTKGKLGWMNFKSLLPIKEKIF